MREDIVSEFGILHDHPFSHMTNISTPIVFLNSDYVMGPQIYSTDVCGS